MKLDRNINKSGQGKYALILLRKLRSQSLPKSQRDRIDDALDTLQQFGLVDYGNRGEESEFFVIRLKDEFSTPGLQGYADEARKADPEYADEVEDMARRSGHFNVWHQKPD